MPDLARLQTSRFLQVAAACQVQYSDHLAADVKEFMADKSPTSYYLCTRNGKRIPFVADSEPVKLTREPNVDEFPVVFVYQARQCVREKSHRFIDRLESLHVQRTVILPALPLFVFHFFVLIEGSLRPGQILGRRCSVYSWGGGAASSTSNPFVREARRSIFLLAAPLSVTPSMSFLSFSFPSFLPGTLDRSFWKECKECWEGGGMLGGLEHLSPGRAVGKEAGSKFTGFSRGSHPSWKSASFMSTELNHMLDHGANHGVWNNDATSSWRVEG